MSQDIAIRVENLSKVFRLGVKDESAETLAQSAIRMVKSPLTNFRKYRSLYRFDDIDENQQNRVDSEKGILHALRDVSFEVPRGQVLGVIGHNGAGKSTLLKIITRITPPTKGQITVHGRVASLLEVGTGFHPELSGRENIYLNGTILGMRKQEVDACFDEIVDFSGVEDYLDTPVKRYSSGMRVRLAFAVAAHLEPEILIIDEVLAVGDAAFQAKCMSKMQAIGKDGRTVLFVSHNMPAINMLCERAVLLKGGQLIADDTPNAVIGKYLTTGTGSTAERNWSEDEAPGGEVARLINTRVTNSAGKVAETFKVNEDVFIEMTYDVITEDYALLPHYHVFDGAGTHIFSTLDQDPTWHKKRRPKGRYRSRVCIPANTLNDGILYINSHLITRNPDLVQFTEQQVLAFTMVDAMGDGSSRGDWAGEMNGVFRPKFEWSTETLSNTLDSKVS